jgi:uncharacterized protein (TIGR04255 family)
MAERPSSILTFANPPVGEVVLSAQFSPIAALQTPHFGLYWQRIRTAFPHCETHPPLEPVFERFEEKPPARPGIRLAIAPANPVPRTWFVSEDRTVLIQLQQDRFIVNWRRVRAEDVYPRYEAVRQNFCDYWAQFVAFLREERLGEIALNQCEVSYINQIRVGDVWSRHGQIGRVLGFWIRDDWSGFLGEPEGGRVSLSFRMFPAQRDSDAPVGRLYIDIQPAFAATTGEPIFVMDLTARGQPQGTQLDGALAFFDLGRNYIVRGFKELTAPEMHKTWGLT